MHMVECEQSAVKKQETAPTAVQAETKEEEKSAASSVPRGDSAAGNEESSDEQYAERQQSENREATAMVSAVKKEEDNGEDLNVEESSAGDNDDLVHPINDVTGDHGNGILAATATEIPTSAVVGGKKRSCEAASSTHNLRTQTMSKKKNKLSHSTEEEAGTTARPRVVTRAARRATAKAHEGTFEGTSRGIEAEEEANDDFIPVHVVEEDGPPLDNDDTDHDEDGNKSIVAERDQQGHSAIQSFDERFKALMDFKQKFGHCYVPGTKSGGYQSLGKWCSHLRWCYKKIPKGETCRQKITREMMQQLDDAGFKWSLSTIRTFDERYAELMKYKEKFGHCNVPQKKPGEYKSLGEWCDKMRQSHKKIQKGETPKANLTPENMQQLDDAGFKWSVTTSRTFDERCAELMKYKGNNGHCDVPQRKSGGYLSLGNWCNTLRVSYKKIQKNETPKNKLAEENIRQLEDAGFKWSLYKST